MRIVGMVVTVDPRQWGKDKLLYAFPAPIMAVITRRVTEALDSHSYAPITIAIGDADESDTTTLLNGMCAMLKHIGAKATIIPLLIMATVNAKFVTLQDWAAYMYTLVDKAEKKIAHKVNNAIVVDAKNKYLN